MNQVAYTVDSFWIHRKGGACYTSETSNKKREKIRAIKHDSLEEHKLMTYAPLFFDEYHD